MNELVLKYREDEQNAAEMIDREMYDRQYEAETAVFKRYGATDYKKLTAVLAWGVYNEDGPAEDIWKMMWLNDLHMYAVLDDVERFRHAYFKDQEDRFCDMSF